MALFLDIGPNDQLRVGADTIITIEHKSGRRARLRIESTATIDMVSREWAPPEPVKVASDGRDT